MKKVIFILASFFSTGCITQVPNQSTGMQRQYLMLFDNIDNKLTNGFDQLFYESKSKGGGENMLQYLPVGMTGLSFTLWHPVKDGVENPLQASFSENGSKESRNEAAKTFLTDLKKGKTDPEKRPEQAVFHQLEELFNSCDGEGDVNYRVVIVSSLLENSGGPIGSEGQAGNWRNGHFRFINQNEQLVPAEIDAARRQISDPKSWISKHLIGPALRNQNLQNGNIQINIKILKPERMVSPFLDRDVMDIQTFWEDLFQAMHLNYSRTFNFSSYNFY